MGRCVSADTYARPTVATCQKEQGDTKPFESATQFKAVYDAHRGTPNEAILDVS